jgi:hypothetical protein
MRAAMVHVFTTTHPMRNEKPDTRDARAGLPEKRSRDCYMTDPRLMIISNLDTTKPGAMAGLDWNPYNNPRSEGCAESRFAFAWTVLRPWPQEPVQYHSHRSRSEWRARIG